MVVCTINAAMVDAASMAPSLFFVMSAASSPRMSGANPAHKFAQLP
jgi:hypothetical protein